MRPADRTAAAILDAAERLFAERGYEGASMGDLADRVGLRKASLFHHFPSKDVLYATVLQQLLDGLRSAITAAASSEGDFEERVMRLTDGLIGQLGAQPHAARLLVREAMDNGPVMREHLAGTVDALLRVSCEFFQAGQRDGAFDSTLVPKQVCVSMMGIFVMPFAVNDVVERFVGKTPFDTEFVEERKAAIRAQVRAMIVRNKK